MTSKGTPSVWRNFIFNWYEYATREIPEHLIVDPAAGKVTILTLVEGLYEEEVFVGGDRLLSPTFPQLQLTATQLLTSSSS
jgi:Uma2 family endonuclease